MSRCETVSVTSRMRSASVDLPWSMCAMIEKLRILLWSIERSVAARSGAPVRAVEPHQPVRKPILLDVPHVPEARLLEGPPRTPIRLFDGGDAGKCPRRREDDVARQRLEHLRAESAARELLLPDQEIDTGDALTFSNQRGPLRMVDDEVRLDHSDR